MQIDYVFGYIYFPFNATERLYLYYRMHIFVRHKHK